jgi:hypothetical protein
MTSLWRWVSDSKVGSAISVSGAGTGSILTSTLGDASGEGADGSAGAEGEADVGGSDVTNPSGKGVAGATLASDGTDDSAGTGDSDMDEAPFLMVRSMLYTNKYRIKGKIARILNSWDIANF